MKYLLDTNSLSKNAFMRAQSHNDVCTLEDVKDEFTSYGSSMTKRIPSSVTLLNIEVRHLRTLQELLSTEGANLDFIRLYTGEGTADALIVAYILSERDNPESLFPEEYTIVTTDTGLRNVAQKYGIACVSKV